MYLYILFLKNHFTTSESSAQEYGRQIEEMRVEVAKQESLVMELKRQIQEKKEKLDAMKKRLERQQAVSKEDKVGISNRNKHHHLKIFYFPFKMWIRFENKKYYIFYDSFRITCNFLRQSCFHEPFFMLICF